MICTITPAAVEETISTLKVKKNSVVHGSISSADTFYLLLFDFINEQVRASSKQTAAFLTRAHVLFSIVAVCKSCQNYQELSGS